MTTADPSSLPTYSGSCHCGLVKWEFEGDRELVAWDCNCSVCRMRRNVHVVVPKSRFRLLRGDDALSCYTFGTHKAKHMFCSTCGILSFYIPRSNPDGIAITLGCIDPESISSNGATVTTKTFDGRNWEASFETSEIKEHSKERKSGEGGGEGE